MPSIPQTLPEISNQVLVQIEVVDGKIYVYPDEAEIYYVWDPAHATPGRPHEVRWMVKGLEPGQHVRIVPKNPANDAFGCGSQFEVPPGYNSVPSGHPRLRPSPPNKRLDWFYTILVIEKDPGGKDRVVAQLDPDIVIKDDP